MWNQRSITTLTTPFRLKYPYQHLNRIHINDMIIVIYHEAQDVAEAGDLGEAVLLDDRLDLLDELVRVLLLLLGGQLLVVWEFFYGEFAG